MAVSVMSTKLAEPSKTQNLKPVMLKADSTESQQGPFFQKTLTSTLTQEFEHVPAGQDVQTCSNCHASTGGPCGFDPASVSLELLWNFLVTCHVSNTRLLEASELHDATMQGKSAAPRLLLHGLVVFNIELLRSAFLEVAASKE